MHSEARAMQRGAMQREAMQSEAKLVNVVLVTSPDAALRWQPLLLSVNLCHVTCQVHCKVK